MMVKPPANTASLQAKGFSFQLWSPCMQRVQEMGPCPQGHSHQVSQHMSCSTLAQTHHEFLSCANADEPSRWSAVQTLGSACRATTCPPQTDEQQVFPAGALCIGKGRNFKHPLTFVSS